MTTKSKRPPRGAIGYRPVGSDPDPEVLETKRQRGRERYHVWGPGKVLHVRDKYDDYLMDASTAEALDAACRKILKERMGARWYYRAGPRPDDERTAAMTDEEIDALPNDGLRKRARQSRDYARENVQWDQENNQFYDAVVALLAEDLPVLFTEEQVEEVPASGNPEWVFDKVSVPRLRSWELLYSRRQNEYEWVDVETVRDARR